MNNKNRFIALFFALFLLSFCLISCETQLGTFDGKISFSLSESTISSIMSRAVSEAGSSNSDILTFKIDLLNSDDSMIDSKSETHSIAEWNTLSNINMSFDNVLVGSYVYAVATVSTPQKVICRGESQKTKVRKNRDTELSITMDYVGGTNTYTITVTLNKPTAYNGLNQISGSLYYLPANSADVSMLKAYAASAANMGSSVKYIQNTDSLTAIVNRATKIKDINAGTVSDTYLLDSEAELNRYIFAKVSYKDSNASSGISCLALPQDSVTLTPSGTTLSLTSYAFGTPYVLWSNRTSKSTSNLSSGWSLIGNYQATTTGAQFFDSINSNQSITNQLDNSVSWNDFCFGGSYLFAVKDNVLHIYEPANSGYTEVNITAESNLSTILLNKRGGDASDHVYEINDIEFSNGYLYFTWSYKKPYFSANYEGLARVKIPTSSNVTSWNLSNCEWAWTTDNDSISGISIFEVAADTIYYYASNALHKRNFTATSSGVSEATPSGNGTISLTGSDSYTLNGSSLGLGANEYVTISDMQLNGSMLYITVYRYDTSVSNGGILKFPVDSDTFEPAVWSQNIPVPKIFGWYKSENETVQPPLNQATKYFYGARKFIAKKPDELVIADDGAFIANNEVYFKTRVATVNLLTESLSMVDVNVTFSSSLFSCGGVKVQ